MILDRHLGRRNLESYLWDDEILTALCGFYGSLDAIPDVIARKQEELENSVSRGNPSNDYKKIAPSLFNFVRQRFELVGVANDARAFERSVLSKFFKSDMNVYKALKASVFD